MTSEGVTASHPFTTLSMCISISLEGKRYANGIYYVSILNNGENITKRLVVAK